MKSKTKNAIGSILVAIAVATSYSAFAKGGGGSDGGQGGGKDSAPRQLASKSTCCQSAPKID